MAEPVPWFFTVSVTEKLPPMTALAGGLLSEVSIRYGFEATTVKLHVPL